MIIAVDGPVAAGKGTLARRLARHFGYVYLDTGALYRAVANRVLKSGENPADAAAGARAAATLTPAELDDPALRSERVGEAASVVSSHPEVREALLAYQRRVAATPPGAVLDGRDIGTVVCPDADVKLFVTASVEARARRRALELEARGEAVDEAEVRAALETRDARDRARAVAPLAPAPDAHLLDTSKMDIETAFRAALDIVASRN